MLPRAERFLELRLNSTPEGTSGWRWFCAVRYLGQSGTATRREVFVWELCEELRWDGQRLLERTGWSVPAVIAAKKRAVGYVPVSEWQPPDGDQYMPSIRAVFPKELWSLIQSGDLSPDPNALRARAKATLTAN